VYFSSFRTYFYLFFKGSLNLKRFFFSEWITGNFNLPLLYRNALLILNIIVEEALKAKIFLLPVRQLLNRTFCFAQTHVLLHCKNKSSKKVPSQKESKGREKKTT